MSGQPIAAAPAGRTTGRTAEILERLVGFASVSAQSNLPLIEYIENLLHPCGFELQRIKSPDGRKAGLFASLGAGEGGVLFSGHTDVVPVDGQVWASDPFRLREEGGRLYGRGAADMKGWLASLLATAETAPRLPLREPFKLLFSYDEEVGCIGIAEMLPALRGRIGKPRLCIVGEPTSMHIAIGHKGKLGLRAICRGQSGHSAFAPQLQNALHPAAELVMELRRIQADLERDGARDDAYGVPYSTLHVGRLRGGVALNMVPDTALLEFELRHLAQDDASAIRASIDAAVERISQRSGGGGIELQRLCDYPGLHAEPSSPALAFARSLLPDAPVMKVDFGSEAGFFAELGIPAVVCGPGSMEQGHRPDEFITLEQLSACDAMLAAALRRLCQNA